MKGPSRVAILHGAFIVFAVALIAQAAKVQVVQGSDWSKRAKRQHFAASRLPAPRGDILDANGDMLVESRELTRVALALPEVRDTNRVINSLRRAKIDPRAVRAAISRKRRWIDLPGVFNTSDVASLSSMSGVHLTPVLQRVYARSSGIRRIVGSLDARGNALDGLELALDPILRGDSGRASLARDHSGRALETPDAWTDEPHAGSTVVLTINNSLQDIAERELSLAVDSLSATGGDIVVMNPHTGEILALASNRVGRSAFSNTAITEPFEPGSTLKPFVAASLLMHHRARPDEIVDTHNGKLEIDGRTITDMHKAAKLSLADVIRFSSNVGIVEFGQRLTHREKYETFRDLGFGMPLGVPLPAEATGTLREPRVWSKQTSASVLMGYEIAVTPLQLVSAYAAIANGGELLEPHLVKEIRSADGKVVYRAETRPVRRVMSGEVARTVQQMLLSVVQEGTATKADLENFDVAGKSGTARRTTGAAGYTTGNYTASFVGLFPANDPQYVVLVKLDSPKGAHYAGGDIAAPVTRVVLRAALASRDAALNRDELAASEKSAGAGTPEPAIKATTTSRSRSVGVTDEDVAHELASLENRLSEGKLVKKTETRTADDASGPAATSSLVQLVSLPARSRTAPMPVTRQQIPDVSNLSLRRAVRALHASGFRVQLQTGAVASTTPAAGMSAGPGTLVILTRPRE
ncbi:MAG TPA: penicillin-binding transpeptidase domain-containing protein [Gemmatimonadaceae bacterium]|nr:penicillin-binding transpeptidase domain-containing protein [Gemmatimonadaceae bacterium]